MTIVQPIDPASRLHLSTDTIVVDVEPEAGGRVAQITIAGTPVLVGRTDLTDGRADGEPGPMAWGSYPMVPWAGRIRRGRFDFRGRTYRLPINFGDHAIHGVGFTSRWHVAEVDGQQAVLTLDLPRDERWPFGGTVRQRIGVGSTHVQMEMEVTAADLAFPVSFGWHPWFRKPESIDFRPEAMYRRDDAGIAVPELVAVPRGPWDDCFVNRSAVLVRLATATLRLTSDCTDWVVYDEPAHATCIEPQTGPPDAFTVAPRILEPGASHRAWYRIEIDEAPEGHPQ
ncbi:MAG: aldose 1-epimerase [Ilumatobacteraceae bacterium]